MQSAGSMTIEETQNGPVFKFPTRDSVAKALRTCRYSVST